MHNSISNIKEKIKNLYNNYPIVFLIGFSVAFVMLVFLPSVKFIVNRKIEIIGNQEAQNIGKLQLYKVQEVEGLRRIAGIQILIDSLQAEKTEIIKKDLSGLKNSEIQAELDKYFNNN